MARRLLAGAVLAPWLIWAVIRVSGVALPYRGTSLLAFTPYVALTAFVPVLVALVLRQRLVALLAVASAVALAACVLPRGFGGPEPGIGPTVTILSANLLKGRADPDRILELARAHDVDMVSLQESDAAFLAWLDRLGARTRYPYRSLRTKDEALLSRLPLTETGRPAEGEIELAGGRRVLVRTVHTLPPIQRGWARAWRSELAALPGTGPDGVPRGLVGDFNATLDHAELRAVLARGYRDAGAEAGDGWRPTWPNGRRFPPGITIDHVLYDDRIGVASYMVEPVRGTDHRAVIATLVVR